MRNVYMKYLSVRMVEALDNIVPSECWVYEFNRNTLNALRSRGMISFRGNRVLPTKFGIKIYESLTVLHK